MSNGTYSATSNNMTYAVHWLLMGGHHGLLRLLQRREDWARPQPTRTQALFAVPNVTAHPSTASVPSPYCCIMICCFAVLMCPLKG